jgi:hypothetical protein
MSNLPARAEEVCKISTKMLRSRMKGDFSCPGLKIGRRGDLPAEFD